MHANKHSLIRCLAPALTIVFILGLQAGAKDVHSDAGTSSFPFLKINLGARAVAMGGAFTGLSDDETAIYYNPAGLAGIREHRFILGYHNYFVDIQSGLAGTIFQLDDQSSLGAYASYLNYGEFDATDVQGNETGETFGGGDLLLGAAYARNLSYNWKVGATVKFIYEKLEDYSATGGAVDLGIKYTGNRERLGLGLAVLNLGSQFSALGDVKYDLPLSIRAGVSYRPIGLPLVLASDVVFPQDNDLDVAIGVEYVELKPVYFRMGWSSFGSNYKIQGSESSWAGFAVGAGFDVNNLHIGYALQGAADLGETHRITFTGKL
jgi:hypothetical protein